MNTTARPDFYLASSEGYGLDEPRQCFAIRYLRTDTRDDLLLVNVAPPISGQSYGLGDQDIEQVILATRHEGETLKSIRSWPVFVHVARPLGQLPENGRVGPTDMEEIAWAEIYESEATARSKVM
jgi:hypothetical protein